jgi:hypothetical protein
MLEATTRSAVAASAKLEVASDRVKSTMDKVRGATRREVFPQRRK